MTLVATQACSTGVRGRFGINFGGQSLFGRPLAVALQAVAV